MPGYIHKTVFEHPGSCDHVGASDGTRVTHVTDIVRGGVYGDSVKHQAQVLHPNGRSTWDENRPPMSDCLQWAAEHPDDTHITEIGVRPSSASSANVGGAGRKVLSGVVVFVIMALFILVVARCSNGDPVEDARQQRIKREAAARANPSVCDAWTARFPEKVTSFTMQRNYDVWQIGTTSDLAWWIRYDPNTDNLKRHKLDPSGQSKGEVILIGDVVLVQTADGKASGYDVRTLKRLWHNQSPESPGAYAMYGADLVVQDGPKNPAIVNPRTGKKNGRIDHALPTDEVSFPDIRTCTV